MNESQPSWSRKEVTASIEWSLRPHVVIVTHDSNR